MKVVILAGGLGTRISEESHLKPKPMIEIGGMPILWHIMKYYSEFGFNEFIICLGYKQYMVKEFFVDYPLHTSNFTLDMKTGNMETLNKTTEDWKVTLVDTGLETMTGGRLKKIKDYIDGDTFMLTYGDGVADVDLNKLLEFHKAHNTLLTITTVSISNQKGVLNINDNGIIDSFREKQKDDEALINGGFMVCNKKVIDYIAGDETSFEKEPIAKLVSEKQVAAYNHTGFWQCMDTQREMKYLCELWDEGKAPWKIWK
jgi:glucose-1-phosphate cytidylyltransferase